MSCTKTNMSALHIWGFERGDLEMRRAREAGWHRSDLIWERLMEAGNRAHCDGRPSAAQRLFRLAGLIAAARFAKGDPRRATALAARAMTASNPARAHDLKRKALKEWQGVEDFIGGLEIRPRARSSLFHLRMEVRHRDTYHDNLRIRFRNFAGETRETLDTIGGAGPGHRHFSRWRGEKPGIFDDTRKLLAACLLLPDG